MLVENKKKPEPQNKKQSKPVNRNKPKSAKPSASKKRVGGMELLRRAAIAATALLLVCSFVWTLSCVRGEFMQKKITLTYSGVLQRECIFPIDFSQEQVRDSVRATKRHGQTHAFSYFCNKTLHLDPVNMTGFIYFGNPADNNCDLVLSVFDTDGVLIYRSGGVDPGKYITQIRPSVEWESGAYACTAYVAAYAKGERGYNCVGVQYSRLTVEVGETS